MTDLSMAGPEQDELAIDESIMPGTFAGPAPARPLQFGTVRTGEVGETGGSPEKAKVFDPALFEERQKQRTAMVSEGMAREVFAADISKEARAARLARKYGLDPSQVTPNLDEFEIKDLAEKFQGAPAKVREWIGSDRLHAMLGYEHVESLGALESTLQNVFEFGKGGPKGAGTVFGTALTGLGVNAAAFNRDQIAAMDRIDAGETVPTAEDPLGYGQMSAEQRAEFRQIVTRQAAVPLVELPIVRAGRALPGQFDVFPARKGFEDSVGRQLGEGMGSLTAGIAMSALTGPIGSGALFSMAGSGEAAERAIEAMEKGGATEDDVIAAARLGIIPGLTDSLPIETLLGRIPVPGGRLLKVPAGMLGTALKGVGRIGWQAFIEGVQEGGQAFLQNLIAREVYKPDQSLTEGLPGDAGMGAGVGGIAQVAKEVVGLIGGRRSPTFRKAGEIAAETQAGETAQSVAAGLTDAMQQIQASPVTKENPEAMKALVAQIAADQGPIYLPGSEAVRLYQDGHITDQTLTDWGVLDQMMEVRATGGDLVISAANFLTSTIAKEAIGEVTRSVRLSAASMTVRESEAFQQDRQARVEELLERMSREVADKPDGAFVYEAIYNALVASGTAAADAKAYANLTAERYRQRATDRQGESADALFVRDNFKVIGPGLEPAVRKVVKDELDVVIARLQSGRAVKTPKTPILDLLKKRGGVEPGSPLATDLQAMGLSAKSNPGLFKAGGLKAADNIVANEETVLADNGIPVDPNGYAQPDAIMAAIREEIAGRPWQTQAEKDRIARLDDPVAELEKVMDKAGFDYRNASPEAIRAFLETQLQAPPVLEGQTETALDQPDGSGGMKRGSFERQRDPYGDIVNIIRLTKNKDRSTFLHESGHFWYFQLVEDAFDPAVRPEARDRLQRDLQTTLDWFGIKIDVKASNPDAIMAATKVEHHEQFARGAETYFMEGKAPSLELKKLFAKFSGWLRSIYRKMRALNVELTDDVRGVFDRLLATEDAIAEAQGNRMYAVPPDLAESLTAAEKANIEKLAEQALLEARIDLQEQVAKEIQREKTDDWKAEKKAVTEEIGLAVRRRPMYAAVNLLRDAKNAAGETITNEDGSPRSFKLNRKELTDRYGEEIVSLLPSGIWARNGSPSVQMDVLAGLAGYDSADALKVALMEAKANPERAVIKAEVEAELKRRHGDLMANIEEEAAKAVANDKQLELMALQHRYVKRLAGDKMRQAATRQGVREGAAPLDVVRNAVAEASATADAIERTGAPAEAALGAQVAEQFARTTQAAQSSQRAAQNAAVATVKKLPPVAYDVGVIKEAAAEFVKRRKVRDLGTPERYETQAARLSRDIEKAIAARDYAKAQEGMEQRLFNLQLAREVRKAGETIEKTRTYLAKFDEKKTRQAMGKAGADYLERIDALLEQYQFKRETNKALDRTSALRDWLAQQEELGLSPDIPASVLDRAQTINYRELTFAELSDLRDAVKSIEHVARFKNKLLRAKEKRELEEVVNEGIATMSANLPPLPPNMNPSKDEYGSNFRRGLVSYFALVKKARTYIVAMDGKEAGGFFDKMMYVPLRNSQIRRLQRFNQEGDIFRAMIEKAYGGAGSAASPTTKMFIQGIDYSMTLEERLIFAMGWGTESNRAAALNDKARGMTEAAAQEILDTLTEKDVRFVQSVWDYIGKFWPEIAALQKQRTGIEPEKVEPLPWVTKYGVMPGGYFPLSADRNLSKRTDQQKQADQVREELLSARPGLYTAAATKRGHTIARTDFGGQSPLWSFDVISRHVNQVLTDVEMGPAVTDAWRILTDKRMQAEIVNRLGIEAHGQLESWLKDVANGSLDAADGLSRAMRGLRTGVSVGAMGFKIATALVQITGFIPSAVRVGYKHIAVGLAKYAKNPVAMVGEVNALSPFMRERSLTFQRDVADVLRHARGKGLPGDVMAAAFWPLAKVQMQVDYPTWLAGYDRAVKEGHSGDDAVAFADTMVEGSQSSALIGSLSPIERGTAGNVRRSEFVKLWTTFYSYQNTKLNTAMQKAQLTNFRNPVEAAKFISDMVMLFVVEAMISEMLLDWMPDVLSGRDDEDDEEDRTFVESLARYLYLGTQSVAVTLPLLREGAAFMEGFDAGPGGMRGVKDVASMLKGTGKSIYALFDDNVDADWWSVVRAGIAAGNVVSPIHYPSGQINVTLKAIEKSSEGEDVSWIVFLIAKRK